MKRCRDSNDKIVVAVFVFSYRITGSRKRFNFLSFFEQIKSGNFVVHVLPGIIIATAQKTVSDFFAIDLGNGNLTMIGSYVANFRRNGNFFFVDVNAPKSRIVHMFIYQG